MHYARFVRCFGVAVFLVVASACTTDDKTADSEPHVDYGGAASGLAYARENCASCHGVEAGQRSPVAAAPTFDALARRPGMNRAALSVLLRTPHRNMPNLIVDPDRVDDLAAYLEALDES